MTDKNNSADPNLSDRSNASKQRILSAALAEFAEHGWGGARVDMIAERAGINKRMLYQYVGNKESLWLAALERVYETMQIGEMANTLLQADPVDGMKELVRYNFKFHAAHPEFVSMLNEENRLRGRNLQRSQRIQKMYFPLVDLIANMLDRGAANNQFRKDVDPVQLYISIAGLSYFYCSNQYTLSAVFGKDLSADDAMLQREAHVVSVVMGFLRP